MAKILIIVDLQRGFITDCSAHVVEPVNSIQHDFDHVVFTKFNNPVPSPFREILDYQKLAPGSMETELALNPREDAMIIDRPLYTCVTQELLEFLKKHEVKEAFVCGIASEACVMKTVLDLFESNIKPLVIEDLCASDQDNHYHKIAMELLAKLIGNDHIISQKQALSR